MSLFFPLLTKLKEIVKKRGMFGIFHKPIWSGVLDFLPQRYWIKLKLNKKFLELINLKAVKKEGLSHFAELEWYLKRGLIESFKKEFRGLFNRKIFNYFRKNGYTKAVLKLKNSEYYGNYKESYFSESDGKHTFKSWKPLEIAFNEKNWSEVLNILEGRMYLVFRIKVAIKILKTDCPVYLMENIKNPEIKKRVSEEVIRRSFLKGRLDIIEAVGIEKCTYLQISEMYAGGQTGMLKYFGYWPFGEKGSKRGAIYNTMRGNQPDLLKIIVENFTEELDYFDFEPVANFELLVILVKNLYTPELLMDIMRVYCPRQSGVLAKLATVCVIRGVKCPSCRKMFLTHIG
jgi:hypothetical protein